MYINSINSTNFQGNKYIINGKQNKEVKYLYNQVTDLIKEQHIPAVYKMGEDIIELSPATESLSKGLKEGLSRLGINFTKDAK